MTIRLLPLTDNWIRSVYECPPPLHRHQINELVVVVKGRGRYFIDGTLNPVEAPAVVIVAKSKLHQIVLDLESQGWVLQFSDEVLPASGSWVFSQFFQASSVLMDPGAWWSQACQILKVMAEMQEKGGVGVEAASVHLLHALLAFLQADFRTQVMARSEASGGDFRLFLHFLELLEAHFRREKCAGFYAEMLGITARHLLRLTHAFMGQTLKGMVEARCVGEARLLLTATDMPIKGIAAELGYFDHSYFTKVFTRTAGQSPSVFRERHLGCTQVDRRLVEAPLLESVGGG